MFMKKPHRVVCIGSASKDIFFPTGEAGILETPEDLTAKRKALFEIGGKYRVADRYEDIGGVAANVGHALATLGIDVGVMSKVGDDEIGRWILSELRRAGVGTDTMTVDSSVTSDLSAIVVLTQDAERVIFHNRDANERLEVDERRLRGVEWIFVSSINGQADEKLRTIFAIAERNGSKIAFNPGQHNLRGMPDLVLELAGQSDLLVLNKDEALELVLKSGKEATPEQLDDEEFLIRTLAAAGAGTIAMTDGLRGAWGFDGSEIPHCGTAPIAHPLDTTGAGDSFAAAFFAAYAFLGKPLREALRYGIVESASVVSHYGANVGHLPLDELSGRVETLAAERVA